MNISEEFERLKQERANRQEIQGVLIGTCTEFCPYYEQIDRTLRKDVNKFETILIKKYQRSAAGKTKAFPEDIRDAMTLSKVVNYLVSLLNTKKAHSFFVEKEFANSFLSMYDESNKTFLHDLYKFIEDRLRAIRLDITVQSLDCNVTISILERIIRFYIYFNYVLYNHNTFEVHLNFEQLKRTLTDLMDIYKKKNLENDEFTNYFYLVNINDPDILEYNYLKSDYFYEELIIAYQQNNYFKYFDIYKKLDFMSSTILSSHSVKLCQNILKIMKNNIIDKINFSYFLNCFVIDQTELISIFEREGIKIENDIVNLQDKNYYEKEIQIRKSSNNILHRKRIADSELVINFGGVDKNIRNIIINEFVIRMLKRKNKFNKIFNSDNDCGNKTIINDTKVQMKMNNQNRELNNENVHQIIQTDNKSENYDSQYKLNNFPLIIQKTELNLNTHHKIKLSDNHISNNIDSSTTEINVSNTKIRYDFKIYEKIRKIIVKHLLSKIVLKNIFRKDLNKHVINALDILRNYSFGKKDILIVSNQNTNKQIFFNAFKKNKLINLNFIETKNFTHETLINFHFVIFVINDAVEKFNIYFNNIRNEYIITTINEIFELIQSKTFINKIFLSKKIYQTKLSKYLNCKESSKRLNQLILLNQNKLNSYLIEKNIYNYLNNLKFEDCDIYYS
ncbi:actin cytoskeleton and mitosis protein [Conglomerata obtusa]